MALINSTEREMREKNVERQRVAAVAAKKKMMDNFAIEKADPIFDPALSKESREGALHRLLIRYKADPKGGDVKGVVFVSSLDERAVLLVRRARRAISAIEESEVNKIGVLDGAANSIILPQRLWEIARLLKIQSDLISEHAEFRQSVATPELEEALAPQEEALGRSVAATVQRVADLEAYALRVQEADSALLAKKVLDGNGKYLDLLSITDDDESMKNLTEQANSVEGALSQSIRSALLAGAALALPEEKPST
ncbi:hypothetical protein ACFQBS_34545 [Planomonospora parontospora]|uniref:hypothetical protein n=1 Tax=Planomonospora parontospora TaxID=58119 RepID=UPI003618265B